MVKGIKTQLEIHEMEVWAVWFEAKVQEATYSGIDTGICKVVLQHAKSIMKKATEVQCTWDRCGNEGRSLKQVLTSVLDKFGVGKLTSEFEHLQHEMLKLVQMLMEQEMLRLYYELQDERAMAAQVGVPTSVPDGATIARLPVIPGDPVWYLSPDSPTWMPAAVLSLHQNGSIMLDIEPGFWVAPQQQAVLLRPRGAFEGAPPHVTQQEQDDARWPSFEQLPASGAARRRQELDAALGQVGCAGGIADGPHVPELLAERGQSPATSASSGSGHVLSYSRTNTSLTTLTSLTEEAPCPSGSGWRPRSDASSSSLAWASCSGRRGGGAWK